MKFKPTTLSADLRNKLTKDGEVYKQWEVTLHVTDPEEGVLSLIASEDSADKFLKQHGIPSFNLLDGTIEVELFLYNGNYYTYERQDYIKNDFPKKVGTSVLTTAVEYKDSFGFIFEDGTKCRKGFAKKVSVNGEDKYFADFGKKARILGQLGVTDVTELEGRNFDYIVKTFQNYEYLEFEPAKFDEKNLPFG